MAFESYYWKKEIKRDISYIQRMIEIKVSSLSDPKIDEHFSKIEIKLFIMAFSIRKLLEAQRLPDSAKDMSLKCIEYKRNDKVETLFSFLDKMYDFENPIKTQLSLLNLTNQFIHAHFFQVYTNRNSYLRSVFVTSDWGKDKHLYSIEIKDFLKFIVKISKMDVKSIHKKYHPTTGKIITILE